MGLFSTSATSVVITDDITTAADLTQMITDDVTTEGMTSADVLSLGATTEDGATVEMTTKSTSNADVSSAHILTDEISTDGSVVPENNSPRFGTDISTTMEATTASVTAEDLTSPLVPSGVSSADEGKAGTTGRVTTSDTTTHDVSAWGTRELTSGMTTASILSSSGTGNRSSLILSRPQRSCRCRHVFPEMEKNSTMTREHRDKILGIVQTLTVTKGNLSATRRRLMSARDDRASAITIGVVGAVLCALPVVLMVVSDVTTWHSVK
ncbi:hypothetical protein BaRGS_00020460 [Batillaria attramentaria]|uniref:Uncharacterized protein n=1 Tax=Batillaria attramentaria TaxID=370345 RepID=A0ABD0KMZ8_9CAEN